MKLKFIKLQEIKLSIKKLKEILIMKCFIDKKIFLI